MNWSFIFLYETLHYDKNNNIFLSCFFLWALRLAYWQCNMVWCKCIRPIEFCIEDSVFFFTLFFATNSTIYLFIYLFYFVRKINICTLNIIILNWNWRFVTKTFINSDKHVWMYCECFFLCMAHVHSWTDADLQGCTTIDERWNVKCVEFDYWCLCQI